jgi:transcriptional regulator with XRE-family HTH domain
MIERMNVASRSTYKIITPEVRTIRSLRVKKGLSVNKAAAVIGTNKSTLTALENGRINLSEFWIDKIIKAYGFNKSTYYSSLNSKEFAAKEILEEINEIASKLPIEKLRAIKSLLMNF